MSEYVMLVCDQCGKKAPEEQAVNWMQVRMIGIDARTIEMPTISGEYCSRKCLIEHLEGK